MEFELGTPLALSGMITAALYTHPAWLLLSDKIKTGYEPSKLQIKSYMSTSLYTM